jgi:hypothetical protein
MTIQRIDASSVSRTGRAVFRRDRWRCLCEARDSHRHDVVIDKQPAVDPTVFLSARYGERCRHIA